MTLAIKHNFVTAKADGTDASLIRPSNWNDGHAITMATNNLLGRATAGAGNAEELPTSAAVIALLASPDLATFLANLGISPPTTGDGRITLKTAPTATWLMMDDGTFGNAGSGASNRANVDCLALFNLLYTFSDAICPVLTSAGGVTNRASLGTAAAAWAALARMTLPRQLGRAIVGAGTGAGLTARALGSNFGAETVLLDATTIPPHQHAVFLKDPSHIHAFGQANDEGGGSAIPSARSGSAVNTQPAFTGITIGSVNGVANDNLTAAIGGGLAHANVQASAAWNVMVKL